MARSASHLAPLALLLSAACTPNTAVLTEGQYTAFLSEDTSFSLKKGSVDPEDWPEADRWNIDCREFENKSEREALELSDPIDVCYGKNSDFQGVKYDYESWLNFGAWRVVREDIEPWRGEAVLTGEGDFQVTFHHRLPGDSDFRFAFVVDPDFEPTECEIQEDGSAVAVPRDGANWVDRWTEDLRALGELDELPAGYAILEPFIDDPDARLYYLNARGYQINPSDGEDIWSIPIEWRAGFGAGKFADEEFHTRAPLWGEPYVYDQVELFGLAFEFDADYLFFCDMEPGEDPAENACMQNEYEFVQEVAGSMSEDLRKVGLSTDGADESGGQGDALYQPMVHNNFWREYDGFPPGFDGWIGLHYNYVVISGAVEPGEPVTGAFSLVYDGDDSSSRFIVQGTFEVPRVKADHWTTVNVEEKKLEENGNTACIQ